MNAGERAPSGLRARIERDLKQETAEIMTAFAGLIPPDLRARAEDADAIAKALGVETTPELKWILSASAPLERIAEASEPKPKPKPKLTPPPPSQQEPASSSESTESVAAAGSRQEATREKYEAVYNLLADGPLSYTELQKRTGWPAGTVVRAIEVLGDRVIRLTDRRYARQGTVDPKVEVPKRAPKPKPPADASRSPRTYTTKAGVKRKVPQQPGIEAVPEHLRHLPAAHRGGPLPQRISAAEGQKKVLDDLRAHPHSLGVEISERTDLSKNQVLRNLHDLAEAGLIKYTGVERSRLDSPGTKPGKVVLAVDGAEVKPSTPPTSARPQDAERVGTDGESASSAKRPPQVVEAIATKVPTQDENRKDREELGRDGAKVLAQVRDYMTDVAKEGQLVTPATIASVIDINREVVLACLVRLAEQGKIKDVSVPGMPAFAYAKPTEPGRAAELDRERGRERTRNEATVNRRADGVEVEGTGRPMRTGNQRSQEIVDAVLAQGGSARFDGRDHVMIMLNGQQRRIARTPGGSGTSARGKAREIGVRV